MPSTPEPLTNLDFNIEVDREVEPFCAAADGPQDSHAMHMSRPHALSDAGEDCDSADGDEESSANFPPSFPSPEPKARTRTPYQHQFIKRAMQQSEARRRRAPRKGDTAPVTPPALQQLGSCSSSCSTATATSSGTAAIDSPASAAHDDSDGYDFSFDSEADGSGHESDEYGSADFEDESQSQVQLPRFDGLSVAAEAAQGTLHRA